MLTVLDMDEVPPRNVVAGDPVVGEGGHEGLPELVVGQGFRC